MSQDRRAFAIVFVRTSDGALGLLLQHKKKKGWVLPGGRGKPGETDEQTVIRETEEETGYTVSVVQRLGEIQCHDHMSILFECAITDDSVRQDEQGLSHRVWTLEELRRGWYYLHKHVAGVAIRCQEKLFILDSCDTPPGRFTQMIRTGIDLLAERLKQEQLHGAA